MAPLKRYAAAQMTEWCHWTHTNSRGNTPLWMHSKHHLCLGPGARGLPLTLPHALIQSMPTKDEI